MAPPHRSRGGWLVLVVLTPLAAQAPAEKPLEKGLREQTQVTIVQVDAVVVDKHGRTVPSLTKDDFVLKIGPDPIAITQLDVLCPIGAAPDPAPAPNPPAPPPAPLAPGVKRRVVFAFDYTFLDITMRPRVLDAASAMLDTFQTDDEEVMIVALASEVRIEQKFTNDKKILAASLARMKHDVTLWPREFSLGVSGAGYFGSLSALMDVLGGYDGPKAVVLFSQAGTIFAAMRDAYYDQVAAHAGAARAAIYPAKPDLLTAGGTSDALSRLANQTGGIMPFFSNDLTLPYRRAQRDLGCRYTVAARVDPAMMRDPRPLSLSLKKPGLSLRAADRVQVLSDEARTAARARAAYIDPGPYERPLVRVSAFPAVPEGSRKWGTLLSLNFPAPVGPAGADFDIHAVLRQNNQQVEDYERSLHVEPAPVGGTSRSVTLMGDTPLKAGRYDLTVVLSDAASAEIVSARTSFVVPEVPEDRLLLQGPVMGRAVPGGLFLRAETKEAADQTRLGKLLGPGNGFEPLLVEEIDRNDRLIFYWSACVSGHTAILDDAVVQRAVVAADGAPAHAFGPIPLALESRGKGVSCIDRVEAIPASRLASGDYHLEVKVAQPSGQVIAVTREPLTVR